jgi:glycosyl hydrolase family 26
MWAKIIAAFATPILAVVLVVAVLKATHHTAVPGVALPTLPATADLAASNGSTKPIPPGPCLGRLPRHFAGLAVKRNIDKNVASFTTITGHAPHVVEFYNPFKKDFASFQSLQVIKAGEVPLIQLNPKGALLSNIAAGDFDPQIKKYATEVRRFGCAIILSFGHEMNGWWYPWGTRHATPNEYISAWRHIHDIFAAEGVRNVIWSWDPSHQYNAVSATKVATPASEWYPGNSYVDIIGIDGYLGYDHNGHPQTFKEIFGYQLHDIRRIAPHKLVYIAETGVTPGPAALEQIRALFQGLVSYRLAGLVWFDALGQADSHGTLKEYRLQRKLQEAAVYREMLTGFLR